MIARAKKWDWALLAGLAATALAIYLVVSQLTYQIGFPLDDAWIHQTYARNLAETGTWAFLPGTPSAGSTSPLWSLLLAIGYVLRLQPFIWTFFLGWAALFGLAWAGNRFGWRLMKMPSPAIPWLGILLLGEWHLVWAAGSGMETGLFAFLILVLFWMLSRESAPSLFSGLVCGLAVWARPDGLTLMGPVLMVIVFRHSGWRRRAQEAGLALLGLSIGLIPYLLFNYALGGVWWPNTLYAKQAEYAILLQEPFLARFAQLASLPLVGVGLLLVPGFFITLWSCWRNRRWVGLAAAAWWLGYTLLYALALPVTYQHGRYLIPAMPVFFILGGIGTYRLLAGQAQTARRRLLRFAGGAVLVLVWLAFLGQGAIAYGEDVAIIETEMVATGRWIAANTPPDALIAAHDIGALGYYGHRELVDLAGLISPQVIPFIRNESQLEIYLNQQKVDYLVTFPAWYPQLVQWGIPVFETQGIYAPRAGGENMVVYQWVDLPPGK